MHSTTHKLRCVVSSVWLLSAITCVCHASEKESTQSGVPQDSDSVQTATFAGGCFWCMEPPFDKMKGVISTTSGYTGGRTKRPTYDQVKTGRTGHIESLQVKFDSNVVTYQQLLSLFWHNVDPTQGDGQFCDLGNQYRTTIFYHDDEQKRFAEASKDEVRLELGKRIHTRIVKASTFYPAEEYHQDYYKKNPTKYKFYRWKCGRDAQLDARWGKKARQP